MAVKTYNFAATNIPKPPEEKKEPIKGTLSSVQPAPNQPKVYNFAATNVPTPPTTQANSAESKPKIWDFSATNEPKPEPIKGTFSNWVVPPKESGKKIWDFSKTNIPTPNQGQPAQPTTPTSIYPTPPTSQQNNSYAMTPEQIRAEAEARVAREIAERTRIANQTKQGLQTQYDRLRTNIGEDRTLENVQMQDRLDPFNARSDYERGILAMQRERSDREMSQDLAGRLANVDMQLADFLNQTPEQQQQIINELTRLERDYGLQVGQLTGNFGGQRTLAGQQFDWGQNMDMADRLGTLNGQRTLQGQAQDWGRTVDEANLTGQYNGQSTLAGRQQNIDTALAYSGLLGRVVTPQQDVSGYLRQAQNGAPMTWAAQANQRDYDYQKQQDTTALTGFMPDGTPTNAYQQQQLQNMWTVANYTGTIPNELADFYGLPRGTKTQEAIQQAQQMAISQQNADTSATNSKMDIWRYTGKAPEGIPGVTAGTPYYDPVAERQQSNTQTQTSTVTAKDSTDNYYQSESIIDDMANQGIYTEADMNTYAGALKDYLSNSDYNKLKKYIKDNYKGLTVKKELKK